MLQQKKSRWKVLLLGLSMGLPLWAQAQDAPQPISPLEARNLATQHLSRVLEWLPPDHLEQFGFGDRDDLSAISIGIPLYQASFAGESVIASEGAQMQTNVVLLPLLLSGKVRCFMYLGRDEEGRWTASGLGGATEAQQWSTLLTAKEAKGHLAMLHIPQNNADYLWQPASGQWIDVSVGIGHRNGEAMSMDGVFREAVKIAAEARATVKDDAGG